MTQYVYYIIKGEKARAIRFSSYSEAVQHVNRLGFGYIFEDDANAWIGTDYEVSIHHITGDARHRKFGETEWADGFPQPVALVKAQNKLRNGYKNWKDLHLVLDELARLQRKELDGKNA
jgi:hypothetical protein